MPHKRLTKPAQAFEYFFEGMRKGQQRDHLIKLEVTAAGTLNAIAFWFDLHLDEDESITTGERFDAPLKHFLERELPCTLNPLLADTLELLAICGFSSEHMPPRMLFW